ALPLLIPRFQCRLNLQTAFLIARRLQARGRCGEIPVPPLPIHRNLETRHSRQYRNLETRHSRAGGNPDPRRGGNLSEITETPRPRFPLPWE
ncbi:TPA: hypothetical protein ACFBWY_001831, partial [Neisseria gonorrhoeae]